LVPQQCRCGSPAIKVILHPPRIFSDLEGYESPVTGKWVEGKAARRRDLEENDCVPYEIGMAADQTRRQAENERKLDAQVDAAVESTMHEMLA
jgi:hypothetical protein